MSFMEHFGHVPGSEDVTSGCMGQTKIVSPPASADALPLGDDPLAPWPAWPACESTEGAATVDVDGGGGVPSGAFGFDGSRTDCETGTGPGEHAAASAQYMVTSAHQRFIVHT